MVRRILICTALILPVVLGCEKQERHCSVSVNVTLDGAPLREGILYFHPTNGGPPAGANVRDGKIEFSTLAGLHRVEIRAYGKPLPQPPVFKDYPEMHIDRREQIIPAQYNTQSKLTAEVKPEGANEFTFDLKSK